MRLSAALYFQIPPMRFVPCVLALVACVAQVRAQSIAAGEAEAAKCLDRIAGVERDVLGKYESSLGDLQSQFQKAADLDGALAVRAERQRIQTEHSLSENKLVNDPRALRVLQQQSLDKMAELKAALVNESVPRLVELKKSLTVAGKLDDAIAVRGLIEKLQNDNLRLERVGSGETVPADTLITAYGADRSRADKTYKGAKMIVRGVVGAFRPDPADANRYTIFVTKGPSTGWVACAFNTGKYRFREEKQFNSNYLVITEKAEVVARVQAGQTMDIQGVCDGFEETVKLSKCEIVR
jgi:hypothetical protein